jgi:hypothetical protein
MGRDRSKIKSALATRRETDSAKWRDATLKPWQHFILIRSSIMKSSHLSVSELPSWAEPVSALTPSLITRL